MLNLMERQFLNDILNYCVSFKLEFDDNNNLVSVTGINL